MNKNCETFQVTGGFHCVLCALVGVGLQRKTEKPSFNSARMENFPYFSEALEKLFTGLNLFHPKELQSLTEVVSWKMESVPNFYLSQRLIVQGGLVPHCFKLMFIFHRQVKNFLRPLFHC